MQTILNQNANTLAMLTALAMVLATLGGLIWGGKITGDSSIATALATSVGTIVGGIAGYSMRRTTDTTAQTTGGVQITKSETGT